MVLSKFMRKRKRELSFQTPKVDFPRLAARTTTRTTNINHQMSLLKTTRTPVDRKVPVDAYVAKSMQIETEALLRNQNPCSVYALATALSQNGRSVMALYEDSLPVADKDEDVDELGMTSMMKRWKRFKIRSDHKAETETPPSDLKRALFTLESGVDSGSNKISNWEEAKTVLSTVIQFPVDESVPFLSPRLAARNDVDEYRKRIKEATQAKDYDVHFEKSREQWEQVAQSRISTMLRTSDEPALVDDQATAVPDAAAKADQLLSERIDVAYEERERLARGEAAREVQERADDAAREEEAHELVDSLLRPLTEEEQEIVNNAIYGDGPPGEIMAKVGTDSVQRQSMQRLENGQWLNDEAIHYFFVMLEKRDEELCHLDPARKRSYFFKSFFMTKLLNEGHTTKDGQYEYNNVKRWSKKVPGKDIFKLDKIFFPINQGRMHWMCAVVNMTEKRIEMYDSMGSNGTRYLKSLFQYIQDEHQAKKNAPLPDIDDWELVGFQPGTPCQQNGFDCGVFTCMFADFLSRDWPLVFTQEHITQCRERIALSIMKGSAII